MQTATQEKLNIKIFKTTSPVPPRRVWQIESFCLKILEYSDYSLRKALAGQLSNRLRCTFFTAQHNDNILAAAGCLYSVDSPAVTILGPVCTDSKHRKKGLALQVCEILFEHLKAQNTQAVYLGVKDNIPATNLYKRIGFIHHSGIVMRKLFVSKNKFDRRYSPYHQTIIRRIGWRDFAEVSAFFCEPAGLYYFDFFRQIFSTRYVKTQTFLPVFSGLMNDIEKNNSCGRVLQTKQCRSIVGTAFIRTLSSGSQSHIAILDFFVLDDFQGKAKELVSETIKQSGFDETMMILCYCLNCDIHKKQILLSLGAEPYTTLPDFIRINSKLQDIIIYKLIKKL